MSVPAIPLDHFELTLLNYEFVLTYHSCFVFRVLRVSASWVVVFWLLVPQESMVSDF